MALTEEQKVELAMEGFKIAKRLIIAGIEAKEREVREEIRKQIADSGDRFRERYPDPLGEEDTGPI